MEEMLYTVSEVAKILKTNTAYVYKLHNTGVLKFIKIGSLKCRKSTLVAFLEQYDGMDVTDPLNIKKIQEETILQKEAV